MSTEATSQADLPYFSFSTIRDFDEHTAGEIRGYHLLDRIVKGLAESIIETSSNVYDIGCSTGRLINQLAARLAAEKDESRRRVVNFVGFEPNVNFSKAFIPVNSSVSLRAARVGAGTTFDNASLVTSLFTLQFVPVRERLPILRNIHAGLNANGAFIFAEKVHASDAAIEPLINDQHLDLKREITSAEAILDKDRMLRSIMHPLTYEDNCRMLEAVGFDRYEIFWRVNNFVAILAIKS